MACHIHACMFQMDEKKLNQATKKGSGRKGELGL